MKNAFFSALFVLILSACTDAGTPVSNISASATVAEPVVTASDPTMLIHDKEPENIEEHRFWVRCGKDKKLGVYFGAHFVQVKVNDADQDMILYPEPTAANEDSIYMTDDQQYKLVIKQNSDRLEWTELKKVAEICEKEQVAVSDVPTK